MRVLKGTGSRILLLLIATALPPCVAACASPFKGRLDNLASASAEDRLSGLVALGHLLDSGEIPETADRLKLMRTVFRIAGDADERPQNAMLAISLAGRYGGIAAVPVLAKRSEPSTEHWPLRQEAARMLGAFPTQESHSALVRVLEKDPEQIVRQEAARSLGECGNEKCLPALVAAAVANPDESVRYTACKALDKLTGLGFGTSEARWEKWWAEQGHEKK
ncbi:MAG: HEAT repeat domain-containing protein [Planctomycetota bacterium]